ncbi:mannose-1-phosphate guanylyltransferase/mannose-6-phosphate isomerase [Sphingopyxis sp. OAS728]|uniref:mannose-1-phosphate guanylyltransferase n=1 Tax=Sphingopyxis sp. OAS728 TaxID=2663823 RepID=UPI0017896E66|nr:sugar phosphate nucleotidyltransferase [Sphingopyxis sp. OAS728]MBE1526917.1 mannose-1-phosphate guanylyltransferase/mannose-6-phosphate isomerase [Sphingopyxis sp. OAS728]
MTPSIQPVILCGGAGTRLWPASRGARAKQFLDILGEESLFARTLARVAGPGFGRPLVICGTQHVAMVRAQSGDHAPRLIVEPAPRNTAAAVALAVAGASPDALLLVMPSDHIITDVAAFHRAIGQAASLAREDWLVTFGIEPERPDTGFGYIASGAPIGDSAFAVRRFIEKPPLKDAEAMLAEGGYSWNAGIFLFRAGAMRAAMLTHCPAIFEAAEAGFAKGAENGDTLLADRTAFEAAPSDSIDYAVMEKHDRVAVVPVAMGWSDLGSWQAVHALAGCDEAGNACAGDLFALDSRGCLVRAEGKRVSLVGMEDVAVIVDGDDILVMPLARSQDVRAAALARQ